MSLKINLHGIAYFGTEEGDILVEAAEQMQRLGLNEEDVMDILVRLAEGYHLLDTPTRTAG